MNKGKEKCNVLKKVRKNIANKIGVDLHQQECTFEGECKGTCPRCQQEEEILNRKLLQKTALVGGIATMSFGFIGCGIVPKQPISGDVQNVEPYENEITNEPSELNLENSINDNNPKTKVIDKQNTNEDETCTMPEENEDILLPEEIMPLAGDVVYIGD